MRGEDEIPLLLIGSEAFRVRFYAERRGDVHFHQSRCEKALSQNFAPRGCVANMFSSGGAGVAAIPVLVAPGVPFSRIPRMPWTVGLLVRVASLASKKVERGDSRTAREGRTAEDVIGRNGALKGTEETNARRTEQLICHRANPQGSSKSPSGVL